MSKLKTLKEIESIDWCGTIAEYALRKEAIEWINELSKVYGVNMDIEPWWPEDDVVDRELYKYAAFQEWCSQEYDCKNVIRWIMHFFNITNDDLKE